MTDEEIGFPKGSPDDKELLLEWLRYLRGAVTRNLTGLTESQARWSPEGKLIPLLGVVRHLSQVEWRWIDGGFGGAQVRRDEEEFQPGPDITVESALASYRERASMTEAAVRATDLRTTSDPDSWGRGHDLRWVLLHLINETARHAGHADSVRELLDGQTGR